VHCVDAIKLKWQDKTQIKSETVAVPQFDQPNDADAKPEPEEIMIDTTSARVRQEQAQEEVIAIADSIGKKRKLPPNNEAKNNPRKERK